jgi:hypothetical protein
MEANDPDKLPRHAVRILMVGTMSGHIRLHALGLALAAILGACGAHNSPRVSVLGVQESNAAPRASLVVFVEVVNPTSRALTLSRLEYRVRARSWFESAGKVSLSRQVGAESSTIVEIPVPVAHSAKNDEGVIPYVLEGKLFAHEDRLERSWNVAVKGALGAAQASDGGSTPIRVTVVDQ